MVKLVNMQHIGLAITLVFLFFANVCSAQDQSDYILLKDSSYVAGEVSINKDTLKLASTSFDKPQFYSLDQVLVFRNQHDLYEVVTNFAVTYDISRKRSEDFHIDMGYAKVKIQGSVSVYEFGFYVENHLGKWRITGQSGFFSDGMPASYMAPHGNGTKAMVPAGSLARGGPYLVTRYLLKRAGSSEVVAVPSAIHPEKFGEFMAAYFADFEALSDSIKKGSYTYSHIEDIVIRYNDWLTQHPDAAKLQEQKTEKLNGF